MIVEVNSTTEPKDPFGHYKFPKTTCSFDYLTVMRGTTSDQGIDTNIYSVLRSASSVYPQKAYYDYIQSSGWNKLVDHQGKGTLVNLFTPSVTTNYNGVIKVKLTIDGISHVYDFRNLDYQGAVIMGAFSVFPVADNVSTTPGILGPGGNLDAGWLNSQSGNQVILHGLNQGLSEGIGIPFKESLKVEVYNSSKHNNNAHQSTYWYVGIAEDQWGF